MQTATDLSSFIDFWILLICFAGLLYRTLPILNRRGKTVLFYAGIS